MEKDCATCRFHVQLQDTPTNIYYCNFFRETKLVALPAWVETVGNYFPNKYFFNCKTWEPNISPK